MSQHLYFGMNSKLDIRRAIKERGLTVKALADKMGISPQSIFQFIRRNPSVKNLYAISDALGCDVRDLFYPADAPAAPAPLLQSKTEVIYCPHCGTQFKILS